MTSRKAKDAPDDQDDNELLPGGPTMATVSPDPCPYPACLKEIDHTGLHTPEEESVAASAGVGTLEEQGKGHALGETIISLGAEWQKTDVTKGTTGKHLNTVLIFEIDPADAATILGDEIMSAESYGMAFNGQHLGEGLVIRKMPIDLDKADAVTKAKLRIELPQRNEATDQVAKYLAKALSKGLMGTQGTLELFATQLNLQLTKRADDPAPGQVAMGEGMDDAPAGDEDAGEPESIESRQPAMVH